MTARTTTRRALLAVGAALGLLVPVAGAASATTGDPYQDGLWYYTDSGMDQIHQRTTGEGITVAVIDGAINPEAADLVGADVTLGSPSSFCTDADGAAVPATATDDRATHGTAMTAIVAGTGAGLGGHPGTRGVAPGATVRHYAIDTPTQEVCDDGAATAAAIRQAVADGADIISMSWNGRYDGGGYDALAEAQRAGVILVAAVSHDYPEPLGWPAVANGVVAVESLEPDLTPSDTNRTDPKISVAAPGFDMLTPSGLDGFTTYDLSGGSSNATAFTSAALALVWSAYPDATANQVLQSLVRNTGGEDHELGRDDQFGYGIVNVRHMLEHDPSAYPDENPLVSDDPDARPSRAELTGAGPAASEPPTSGGGTAEPPAAAEDDASSTLLVVGVGVLVLVVVAVVLTVVLVSRRRRATPEAPAPAAAPSHQTWPPGA